MAGRLLPCMLIISESEEDESPPPSFGRVLFFVCLLFADSVTPTLSKL